MKIENDADPCVWFSECLQGPEPQDWMKDVGLDWFDEELLGRPESPAVCRVENDDEDDEEDDDDDDDDDNDDYEEDDDFDFGGHRNGAEDRRRRHQQVYDYPSYTIESSAWLIQQNRQSVHAEDESTPPPVLPPMIPGTRSFSDELHRIRKPYALGSSSCGTASVTTTAAGFLVRQFSSKVGYFFFDLFLPTFFG